MTLSTSHVINDTGHVADHNAMATQVNQNTSDIAANKGLPVGATGATQPTRYVGRWSTVGAPVTGTFAVGDFGFDGANTVQICTVAGSPGTFAASAASGAAVGLLSARPAATGSKALYYATDTTTLYEDTATGVWTQIAETVGASANSRLIEAYGVTAGLPNLPWQRSATVGANLWALVNFSSNTNGSITPNTTTLTPTLTSDGATNKNSTTRIVIPTTGNITGRYRVDVTLTTNITAGGNARFRVIAADSAGAAVSFYDSSGNLFSATFLELTWNSTTNVTGYRFIFEVDCSAANTSPVYLDVQLKTDSGAANGSTIGITNASVYRVQHVTPRIRATWDRGNGGTGTATNAQLILSVPCGYDATRMLHRTQYTFANDNGTNLCPMKATDYQEIAYSTSSSRYLYNVSLAGQYPNTDLFINNSDTVLTVYKADGVTTELRGNTHGGEAGASGTWGADVQVFFDYGDGVWAGPFTTTSQDYTYWRHVMRVKIISNMALTRSDQPGVPFATLSKTYYVYADGTVRYDRTVTFNQDQKIDRWFWHMISVNPAAGLSAFVGRLGRGAQILAQMDSNAYLGVPVLTGTPTVTATGGFIPASTRAYSVRVTALGPNGETTGSINNGAVSVTVANSTVAATWSAITGATGYAIYFGHPGFEKRVATVASPTVTYTITGSELPGQGLPQTSTAVTTTQTAMTSSAFAEWSAYYDAATGHVLSLALDRASLLSQPQVLGVRTDLQRIDASIMKNYWQLQFDNGGNDLPYTIPNGSVYTGTLWYFNYIPADPVNFEREQTLRAASAAQLPNIYTT